VVYLFVGEPFFYIWEFAISWLLCSLVMNLCMFLRAPSCVAVGQLASQYGVVRAMWM